MDKSITIRSLITIAFCAIIGITFGQNKLPIGLKASGVPTIKPTSISTISYQSVQNLDLANNWQDRVSVPTEVAFDMNDDGQWYQLKNGDRIWRLRIQCANAKGMAMMFRQVSIPSGATLHLYATDGSHVLHSFESKDVNPSGNLMVGPIIGTDAILEYYEPAAAKGLGKFDLFRIQRLYKDYLPSLDNGDSNRAFGDAWDCQVNVNCDNSGNFDDAKRSVTRILMTMEEGMVYCTGTLMNNTAQDMIPYVLSAFHCTSDLTPLYDFFRFDFNYTGAFCSNPTQEPPYQSLLGCASISGSADTDFELMRLFQSIPASFDAYFAGWNRVQDYTPDTTTLIHHPSGDIKKITQDFSKVVIFNSTVDWDNGLVTSSRSHFRNFPDLGAFQGGSSGAPLLDHNGHVIGQLHGGDALCDTPKAFSGRIARSWEGGGSASTRLREHLDPLNSGSLIQNGFDPNNSNSNTGSITGRVVGVTGSPMRKTVVYLNTDGTYPANPASIVTTTNTDDDGFYSFDNVAMGIDYYVSATNDRCKSEGLGVSDVIRIQSHLLFIDRLTSPEQYIVADVNDDGAVSVNDMLFVRFLLLGNITEFPNSDSYMILRGDMVFEEDNPLPTDWKSDAVSFKVNSLSGPALVPDFVAYKIGDSTLSSDGCDE